MNDTGKQFEFDQKVSERLDRLFNTEALKTLRRDYFQLLVHNRVNGFLISAVELPQTPLLLQNVLQAVAAFLHWITAILCLRLHATDFNNFHIKIQCMCRKWMLNGLIFQVIHLIHA